MKKSLQGKWTSLQGAEPRSKIGAKTLKQGQGYMNKKRPQTDFCLLFWAVAGRQNRLMQAVLQFTNTGRSPYIPVLPPKAVSKPSFFSLVCTAFQHFSQKANFTRSMVFMVSAASIITQPSMGQCGKPKLWPSSCTLIFLRRIRYEDFPLGRRKVETTQAAPGM